MSDALVAGLAQGGATALLLGIVLMVLMPKAMAMLERHVTAFRDEIRLERDAHRAETHEMTQAMNGFCRSTTRMSAELQEQTDVLRDLARASGVVRQRRRTGEDGG